MTVAGNAMCRRGHACGASSPSEINSNSFQGATPVPWLPSTRHRLLKVPTPLNITTLTAKPWGRHTPINVTPKSFAPTPFSPCGQKSPTSPIPFLEWKVIHLKLSEFLLWVSHGLESTSGSEQSLDERRKLVSKLGHNRPWEQHKLSSSWRGRRIQHIGSWPRNH